MIFATFISCNNLFANLSQYLIPANFNFFEKCSFLLFFPKNVLVSEIIIPAIKTVIRQTIGYHETKQGIFQ